MPPANILVLPGGLGSRVILSKTHIINWIIEQAKSAELEYILSVCTGSLLLAKAGLLNELEQVTTHSNSLSHLEQLLREQSCSNNNKKKQKINIPKVVNDKRYIDATAQGGGCEDEHQHQHPTRIIMSGGISAGIDMCLYVVQKLCGNELLSKTVKRMEYAWTPDDQNDNISWLQDANNLIK